MGSTLCCFGQFSPEILPKHVTDGGSSGHRTSMMTIDSMNTRSLLIKDENKRQQLHQEEKQQQQQLKMLRDFSTLEEWFLASPGLKNDTPNRGEFHVLKQSSNRVYPSLTGDGEDCTSKFSDICCNKRLLKFDKEDHVISLSSRSQIRKSNKKVTFRLPEEADIFIIYSPRAAV